MEHVLRDCIGKFVILYIEKILIYSNAFKYHFSHAAHFLQTLKPAHLM